MRQRDSTWVLVGFRNLEREGVWSFEIMDPIPVHVGAGVLVADPGHLTRGSRTTTT